MKSFKVTLIDPAGKKKILKVPDGEFILDFALEHEMDIEYGCQAGACGTCRGQLVSGQIDQSDGSWLSDDEIAAGQVLICVAYAESDCVIKTHQEELVFENWRLERAYKQ